MNARDWVQAKSHSVSYIATRPDSTQIYDREYVVKCKHKYIYFHPLIHLNSHNPTFI